jgi:hypothetical protein
MATKKTTKKAAREDFNQTAHRVFGELVERSETPPNRGSIKAVPPPAKKNGTTKK